MDRNQTRAKSFAIAEEECGLPLSRCKSGDEGEIVGMDGDTAWAARLRELGFENGRWVRVARGGSPLLVEIGAARFAVRAEEADHVSIRLEPAALAASEIAAALKHAP